MSGFWTAASIPRADGGSSSLSQAADASLRGPQPAGLAGALRTKVKGPACGDGERACRWPDCRQQAASAQTVEGFAERFCRCADVTGAHLCVGANRVMILQRLSGWRAARYCSILSGR